MSLDPGVLFASVVFSAIGFALFTYGRKRERLPQVVIGVVLMVYGYFIPTLALTVIVGVGLIVLLWLLVRFGM